MSNIKRIRWILGLVAVGLFALQAVVFKTQFPAELLFPQQAFAPYPESALPDFAQALGDQLGLYRFLILGVDTAFILVFGMWVYASFLGRASTGIGAGFAFLPVIADFTENMMIVTRMGIATKGNIAPELLLADPSPTHYVTLVKFALFAISLLAVARLWRRDR